MTPPKHGEYHGLHTTVRIHRFLLWVKRYLISAGMTSCVLAQLDSTCTDSGFKVWLVESDTIWGEMHKIISPLTVITWNQKWHGKASSSSSTGYTISWNRCHFTILRCHWVHLQWFVDAPISGFIRTHPQLCLQFFIRTHPLLSWFCSLWCSMINRPGFNQRPGFNRSTLTAAVLTWPSAISAIKAGRVMDGDHIRLVGELLLEVDPSEMIG